MIDDEAIGKSVDKVFAEHKGRKLNSYFVITSALIDLGVSAHEFHSMHKRVKNYLKDNSGIGQKYLVWKGKNGGMMAFEKEMFS